jgi:hypothetical protein
MAPAGSGSSGLAALANTAGLAGRTSTSSASNSSGSSTPATPKVSSATGAADLNGPVAQTGTSGSVLGQGQEAHSTAQPSDLSAGLFDDDPSSTTTL